MGESGEYIRLQPVGLLSRLLISWFVTPRGINFNQAKKYILIYTKCTGRCYAESDGVASEEGGRGGCQCKDWGPHLPFYWSRLLDTSNERVLVGNVVNRSLLATQESTPPPLAARMLSGRAMTATPLRGWVDSDMCW